MKHGNLIICILLALLSCSGTRGGGENLSEAGFYGTPDDIITSLSTKGINLSPAGHFLLGTAWKEKKDYKKALFHMASSCFSTFRPRELKLYAQPVYRYATSFHIKSEYYDDALYEIADLFYLYREHEYVDRFLDKVSKDNMPLYLQARLLKAQNYRRWGKTDQALQTLDSLLGEFTDPSSRSIILVKKASMLEDTKAFARSARDYLEILSANPGSWQAAIAAEHLLGYMRSNATALDENDKGRLGIALYNAQKYRESREILHSLKSIATNAKSDIFVILVRASARTGDIKTVNDLIHKLRNEEHDINIIYADELWSMGKKYAAIPYYKTLLQAEKEDIRRTALQRIAFYMEQRTAPEFVSYMENYIKTYPGDLESHAMLWLLARHHIKNDNTTAALASLEESNRTFPHGKYSDQCRFWLYKIRLNQGDKNGALSAARDLIVKNPDSPYAWTIAERLAGQQSTESLKKEYAGANGNKNRESSLYYHALFFIKSRSMTERNTRLAEIPGSDTCYKEINSLLAKAEEGRIPGSLYPVLEKYFRIGLDSAIERTCSLLPKNRKNEAEKNAALAILGQKYQNYFYTVYHTQELLKILSVKEDIFTMPEKLVKLLLPLSFPRCLETATRDYTVPGNMIQSVIKAESLFNHGAVSSAGAVGLMQLMPPTARDLARELAMDTYDLKNPCISIQFGARYLAWLEKFFRNNFTYMVAGYNAGAGNVQKWRQKFASRDDDFFTEFIPFQETRYYILRTGKFLIQYDTVYGR